MKNLNNNQEPAPENPVPENTTPENPAPNPATPESPNNNETPASDLTVVEALKLENAKLVQEKSELIADLQRTRADFENFRKQIEAQKENERRLTKYATVQKILPIIDDLSRGIKAHAELKPLAKNFEKTLNSLGISEIDSRENTSFDPEKHNATAVEGDGEKEVIAETLQPGYFYEGEVLRPAMVKVKRI